MSVLLEELTAEDFLLCFDHCHGARTPPGSAVRWFGHVGICV